MTKRDKVDLMYSIMGASIVILIMVALITYTFWAKQFVYLGSVVLVAFVCLIKIIATYLQQLREWKKQKGER